MKPRISEKSVPITDTIPKNNLQLFILKKRNTVSEKQEKLMNAKINVALFSRLFIACQLREGDLETFFQHENQAFPPSLSENGHLRPEKSKSDIIACILRDDYTHICESPNVEVKIFDGSALVNMIHPVNCKTFEEYARNVFSNYFKSHSKSAARYDLVFWIGILIISLREEHAVSAELEFVQR